MARRRTPHYSHTNSTTCLCELIESNGDKTSQQSGDDRARAIRLCHRGRAAFLSAFDLDSEALDERRRARSTHSHKIAPLRP